MIGASRLCAAATGASASSRSARPRLIFHPHYRVSHLNGVSTDGRYTFLEANRPGRLGLVLDEVTGQRIRTQLPPDCLHPRRDPAFGAGWLLEDCNARTSTCTTSPRVLGDLCRSSLSVDGCSLRDAAQTAFPSRSAPTGSSTTPRRPEAVTRGCSRRSPQAQYARIRPTQGRWQTSPATRWWTPDLRRIDGIFLPSQQTFSIAVPPNATQITYIVANTHHIYLEGSTRNAPVASWVALADTRRRPRPERRVMSASRWVSAIARDGSRPESDPLFSRPPRSRVAAVERPSESRSEGCRRRG